MFKSRLQLICEPATTTEYFCFVPRQDVMKTKNLGVNTTFNTDKNNFNFNVNI